MSKFTAVGFLSPKQSRPRNWFRSSQVARVIRGSCRLCPGPEGSCSGDGQQGGQLSSLLFFTSSHTYHPCPWPIAHALQKSGSSPSLGTKSHDLKMRVDNTSCQRQRLNLGGLGGAFRSAGQRGGQAGDWRRAGGRLGRSGGLRIGFSAIEHAVSGLAVPRWWRCPTPKLSSCQSTSRTGAREWCRGTPSVFLSCPIPFSMSARRRVQMCLSLQKMVVARHCTGGHGVRDGRCRGAQHIAAEAYGAPLLVNGGPQQKLQIQTAQVRQAKVACG